MRFVNGLFLSLAVLTAACGSSDSGESGESIKYHAEFVAHFAPEQGQLPEGLVVQGDHAYVGFAPTGRVARVELATGAVSDFAQMPAPVPNQGFLTGLELDAAGALYAALVSFNPEVQPGIYRAPASGGGGTLFAAHEHMAFPNGLDFDAAGHLFVSDSGAGSIFRIAANGEVEEWFHDDALAGDTNFCGEGLGAGFDIGVNGLIDDAGSLYVVNNDKASLFELPINADGTPGALRTIVEHDCAALGGADGLTRQADGSFLVAVNRQDKLVRVDADGTTTDVLVGGELDFPASFGESGDATYVTNFALNRASAGESSQPGLLRLRR
ncbi:MAG: hypothetical protein H6718_29030 [Polyangiaceae bacterium]|nr:hypothetical protein [Polyangiaceae bacterium]